MESRLQQLREQSDATEAKLRTIRGDLAKARKAVEDDETESLIESRKPDAGLQRKVSELEREAEKFEGQLKTLSRAISVQAGRVAADRDAARTRQIAEFRLTKTDTLNRIESNLQGLHDATSEFFFDLEGAGLQLDGVELAQMLFRPNGGGGYELGQRAIKLNMINQVICWLQHDAGYRRGGRPEQAV